MADLRGQELKDSYQNVVTRGTGNKLDNGNGVEFADLDDKASLSAINNDPNFYEEGLWTPVFQTTGDDFDSIAYDIQDGLYVRSGNIVFISGTIRTSSITIGGATGDVLIGGLPFVISGGNSSYSGLSVANSTGWGSNFPTNGRAFINSNATDMRYIDTSSFSKIVVSDLATGGASNLTSFSMIYNRA